MRKVYLVWLGLIFSAASCVQLLDGNYEYKPRCDAGSSCESNTPCNEDANCDDNDQCTFNTCGAGKTCEFKPVDGLAPEQKAGDCLQAFCNNGTLMQIPDDNDLPNDDQSCTKDICINGSPVYQVLPDGLSCAIGNAAGLCLMGLCIVDCTPQDPCDDGNPCTEDSCNVSNGVCTFATLNGLPTPGYTPIVGDCSQEICVNGLSTAISDDADLPDDMNICTKDSCSSGKPVFAPINFGAHCLADGSGICDAMGKCLECISPVDCPPLAVDNGCHIRTCDNNKCGDMIVGGGIDVEPSHGDCKGKYCDAAGNATMQNNDLDVPDDNNPCTKNVCTNGIPSNPFEASGKLCNGGQLCDGAGHCACLIASDCGTDDDCKSFACTNNKCQIAYEPQGMATKLQNAGDCKANACDGAGNVVATIDAFDVPDDKNDCTLDSCNGQGMPQNTFKPLNGSCNQNGGTVCNGFGACLDALGANCTDTTQCASGFCTDGVCCADTCTSECMACNVMGSSGICTNVSANSDDAPLCTGTNSCDGMGNCKRDNGQGCSANADCSSGFCTDGVCCNAACNDTCKSCNVTGSVGTCTFVPYDSVDPTGTTACNNPYRCDGSGACKGLNSVTCAQGSDCLSGYCVDGYCCNNACSQLCKACSGALTGSSNGLCAYILNGTDPQNECPNGDCNGAGTCIGGGGTLPNGSACTAAGACLSGFCADGVCCNAGCTETCKACNVTGFVGTCTNVPNDNFDNNAATPCNNGHKCDGNGNCKGLNSIACTMSSQCLSNYCVDGFCCNSICNGVCKSCASTLNAGADGTCGNTKSGIDPDNECNGGKCNGMGACMP